MAQVRDVRDTQDKQGTRGKTTAGEKLAEVYERLPDGETLYERAVGWQPGEDYRSHDWSTVLESMYDDDGGKMGYIQVATFQGASLSARPEAGDYRRDVVIQLLSANGEPVEMALSWKAAKALCAAMEDWEQEHPEKREAPDLSRN